MLSLDIIRSVEHWSEMFLDDDIRLLLRFRLYSCLMSQAKTLGPGSVKIQRKKSIHISIKFITDIIFFVCLFIIILSLD